MYERPDVRDLRWLKLGCGEPESAAAPASRGGMRLPIRPGERGVDEEGECSDPPPSWCRVSGSEHADLERRVVEGAKRHQRVGSRGSARPGDPPVWHAMKRRLRACPPSKPPGAECRVTNPGENSPRQGLPRRPAFAHQVSIRPSSRSEQWKCWKSDGPSTPSCVVPSALKR